MPFVRQTLTSTMTPEHNPRKVKRSVACRECQRLKLKCNRSWPCESCSKRGVADICPEGVLPTTKRQRSNLIDTSRIYEKNVAMSDRIRQLETALAAMQSNVSNETHPLLNDELLHLGTPIQCPPEIEGIKSTVKTSLVEETIDAFGTLKIKPGGRTVFHNQAVSADYLVASAYATKARDRAIAEAMVLPAEIISLGTLFPFGDARVPLANVKRQILSFLPSANKVRHLAENYFTYFTWWLDPLPRDQFEKEIYPLLSAPEDEIRPDRLSTLFMILGIGTTLDNDGPMDVTSADSYLQLARATFCLEPLLDVSTLSTIQALQLVVAYIHTTGREKVEHLWVLLGLVSRLSHSSGLHFDPENWIKNDPVTVQRRRKILHEAVAYDALMSFVLGRPPGFKLAHIQCKLPEDDDRFITETGVGECGFPIWRYRFTKDCLFPVMDEAFGAKPPSYTTILRLDRTLREFPAPSHLVYPGLAGQPDKVDSEDIPFRIWMQRTFLFCLKEMSIICLHRAHFGQAIKENPENPFEGKYAASVLATFRSASRIIALVRDISTRYPTPISRVWWLWQNIFSAGIILAMVVFRSPRCKLAKPALVELQNANDLLQNRSVSCRAEHYRDLMTKLLGAAEETFRLGTPSDELEMIDDDELVLFTAAARNIAPDGPPEPMDSMLMPQVESQSEQMVSSWNDAHPDLLRFFNQGISTGAPDNGHGNEIGSIPMLTPSMHISESAWQTMMSQLAY